MSGAPLHIPTLDPDSPAGRVKAAIEREWLSDSITPTERGEVIGLVQEYAAQLTRGLETFKAFVAFARAAERVS